MNILTLVPLLQKPTTGVETHIIIVAYVQRRWQLENGGIGIWHMYLKPLKNVVWLNYLQERGHALSLSSQIFIPLDTVHVTSRSISQAYECPSFHSRWWDVRPEARYPVRIPPQTCSLRYRRVSEVRLTALLKLKIRDIQSLTLSSFNPRIVFFPGRLITSLAGSVFH